jgi:hypothetical protein
MATEAHMIGYLLENFDKLTDWEKEFVTNISELASEVELSAERKRKLKEIYDAY